MNADGKNAAFSVASKRKHRSRQSLEFEALWRNLPKQAQLPHKRDFNPGRAASLLRYIMLLEARLDGAPAFPIRLVGSEMVERIHRDIKGHDYLEFLSPNSHAGAIETARLMFAHPCGLWQITPLHYERGIAQNVEITAFPLLGEPLPFVVSLVVPQEDFVRPVSAGQRAMLAEPAVAFEFLDLGSGVPDWPAS